jgi:hypothetical protein
MRLVRVMNFGRPINPSKSVRSDPAEISLEHVFASVLCDSLCIYELYMYVLPSFHIDMS